MKKPPLYFSLVSNQLNSISRVQLPGSFDYFVSLMAKITHFKARKGRKNKKLNKSNQVTKL